MQLYEYHYARLKPDEHIKLHEQPTWELTHVILGSGHRIVGNREEPFHSGEVVLIPPGMPHCWQFSPTHTDDQGYTASVSIMITKQQLQLIAQAFPSLEENIESLINDNAARIYSGKYAAAMAEIICRMANENEADRAVSMLQLVNLATRKDSVGKTLSYARPSAGQMRMMRIHVYVISNFYRKITLNELASHIGVNRTTLSVFVKRNCGKTISEYLNDIRIEQACELLEKENMPINKIADHVGYTSMAYFNRMFRKLKKCTPKEYRALATQKQGSIGIY